MTRRFRIYSQEMLPIYIFICVLFMTGVVFGSLLVNALTMQQVQEVSQYLTAFLQPYMPPVEGNLAVSATLAQTPPPAAEPSIFETFGSHVRWLILIWLLGLSVVGAPLILLLNFVKGMLLGFTIGFMAGQWSWQGMLLALVSVAPQNMIAVPALIVLSVVALRFTMVLVRSHLDRRTRTMAQPFLWFTLTACALSVLLFGVALLETYVSPALLHWVTPMVMGGV